MKKTTTSKTKTTGKRVGKLSGSATPISAQNRVSPDPRRGSVPTSTITGRNPEHKTPGSSR